jgi:hypothetical protein
VDLDANVLEPPSKHDVGNVNSVLCAPHGIVADGDYHAALTAYDYSGNESAKTAEADFTLNGGLATVLNPSTLTTISDGVNPNLVSFAWAAVQLGTAATVKFTTPAKSSETSLFCTPKSVAGWTILQTTPSEIVVEADVKTCKWVIISSQGSTATRTRRTLICKSF